MKMNNCNIIITKGMTLLLSVVLTTVFYTSPAYSALIATSVFTENNVSGPPGDEITIINSSTPGSQITSIIIDLSGSSGSVVFDPNTSPPTIPPLLTNVVGDAGFLGSPVFSDGFIQGSRTVFRSMSVEFGDFDAGEEIRINLDLDANDGLTSFISGAECQSALKTFHLSASKSFHIF